MACLFKIKIPIILTKPFASLLVSQRNFHMWARGDMCKDVHHILWRKCNN